MIRQADPSTIAAVLAAAVSGDEIELASGDYRMQVNITKAIQLRAISGQKPVMLGSGQRFYTAVYVNRVTGALVGPGLQFSNPLGDGCKFSTAAVSSGVEGCLFYRCGAMGASVQSGGDVRDIFVRANEFDQCGYDITLDPHSTRPGTGLHSIYMGGGTGPCYGGVVERNWVHDSLNGQAIQIGGVAQGAVVRRNTVQRVSGPAIYADDQNGIGVYSSETGADEIEVYDNLVEDVTGHGYVSHAWEATARSLATFQRNAGRRCARGVYEQLYGGRSWATFGAVILDPPAWKLGTPKPIPAADSPLVGAGLAGSTIGAFDSAAAPPPPPPADTALAALNREWAVFLEDRAGTRKAWTQDQRWRADNPGEYALLLAYRGGGAMPVLSSEPGRRMVEHVAAWRLAGGA